MTMRTLGMWLRTEHLAAIWTTKFHTDKTVVNRRVLEDMYLFAGIRRINHKELKEGVLL